MKKEDKKSKEELIALREAQKRLTWIENVKRIEGYSQEEAESAWEKIFNPESWPTIVKGL